MLLASAQQQAAAPQIKSEKGDEECPSGWIVSSNVLFLSRGPTNNATLVRDLQGVPLLQAQDLNFGFGVGWDLDVIRRLNCEWGVEGRVAQVNGITAKSGTIDAPAGFILPFAQPVTSTFPSQLSVSDETQLLSVEVNARRTLTDRLTLLGGVRYLGVNDYLNGTATAIGAGGSFLLSATNDMIGGQIGADAVLFQHSRFQIDGIVKAGAYGNSIVTNTTLTDNTGTLHAGSSKTQFAFEGELTVDVKYHVTDAIALKGGYQVMWFDGLAGASDQMATTDIIGGTAAVNVKSSPILHGAFAGAEVSW